MCRACEGARKVRERLASLPPEAREKEEIKLANHRASLKRSRDRRRKKREKEKVFTQTLANQAASTGKLDVTQAGEIAGIPGSTARELWHEDRIRAEFRSTLHAKGVNKEKIAQTILEGLDANDLKVLSKDGVLTGTVPIPNWLARHKFTETGLKALRLIEEKKEDQGRVAVFNLIAPRVQVPGHEPGCRCDKCEAVRQREREKLMARENYIPEEFRVIDVAPSDDPFDKEKK